MAWSCVRCGQAVDWLGDPITGIEGHPLCYRCAEDEADQRERTERAVENLITCTEHPERPAVLRETITWIDGGGVRRISSRRLVAMCDVCRAHWDAFDAAMRNGAPAHTAFHSAHNAEALAESARLAAERAQAVQVPLLEA